MADQDRYATALAVANAISTDPNVVLAATGADFPDALSAGAAAGACDVPGTGEKAVVVLTSGVARSTPLAQALRTPADAVAAAGL